MKISSSVAGRGANLLLLGVSVLLVLVGIELALTLFYPTQYMKAPDHTSDGFFRAVLHQRSDVPGLSFELAPNRRKKLKGIGIRTNSLGMRDAEPLPIESEAVSRIVILGDSYTFGWGVDGNSTYPTVLEKQLNDGSRERPFEVLNLGVCGYNTQDEAVVLEHKGLLWRPDLIVLSYVLNDPETDPIQPLNHHFHEFAVWQRTNLGRLAAQGLRDFRVALWGAGDYYEYLHAEDQHEVERRPCSARGHSTAYRVPTDPCTGGDLPSKLGPPLEELPVFRDSRTDRSSLSRSGVRSDRPSRSFHRVSAKNDAGETWRPPPELLGSQGGRRRHLRVDCVRATDCRPSIPHLAPSL